MSEIVPHTSNCEYWAVRPALKRAIIGRLDSLSCNGVRETTRYISYIYSTHQAHIDIPRVGQ
jgi:hypothetical protein